MDKEYLSQFNKDVEPVEVPFQKPLPEQETGSGISRGRRERYK